MDFQHLNPIHQLDLSAFSHNQHLQILKNSLFTFDTNIKSIQTELLRVDVKCMMNQEFIILKSGLDGKQFQNAKSIIDAFQLNKGTPLIDIKIEYSFYINASYLDSVSKLREFYNEEENVVQIILLCSHGIKTPTASDFQLFFCSFDDLKRSKSEFKNLLDTKTSKQVLRLLICACILEEKQIIENIITRLSKSLSLESLIKILMVCLQYESMEYAVYFYRLLLSYFQYEAGLLSELNNPLLQEIIQNILNAYIQVMDQDIFILKTKKYHYKIDSIFFKPLQRNIEIGKRKFLLPLQKYQFFKTIRKQGSEESKENSYPHYFQLKDESLDNTHLYAYQENQYSEILIFEKEQVVYRKYTDDYIGSIERNYWGTSFQVYDYGYPEDVSHKVPKYIGFQRTKIVSITYQTNIMASAPRKFTCSMLNYVNKQDMLLQQLEPQYNAEKDCYQLNFYGRAKKASARNFELIDPFDHNIIYLLHGKWDKNVFNIDYRYPMTQLQAFSFSLISISKKYLVA